MNRPKTANPIAAAHPDRRALLAGGAALALAALMPAGHAAAQNAAVAQKIADTMRVLGATRGLIVSAVAGALISSTAVTVALARAARPDEPVLPMAGAAVLAAVVSIMRVCLVVAIVQIQVLGIIGPAVVAAAAVFGVTGLLLMRRGESEPVKSPIHSPFELGPLLLFAALLKRS